MSAQFFCPASKVSSTPHSRQKLLIGALFVLTLGLLAIPAVANEGGSAVAHGGSVKLAATVGSTNRSLLKDGVYLYGQAPKANRIGAAYMVVKVNKQQVVGAFYMPSSSFDCFQGKVDGEQLALTIVDSYERTAYPYSVALQSNTTLAASKKPTSAAIAPAGYYPIQTVSENDRRILSQCQANYQ